MKEGDEAWSLERITEAGHAQDGSQVWFKLVIAGSGQEVSLIMSPEVLSNLLANLHQLAQSADRHRVLAQGQGRPGPMPLIEVEQATQIDLFDPQWRAVRLHIGNSSTLDLAMTPMTAAQLANLLKGRSRSKGRGH